MKTISQDDCARIKNLGYSPSKRVRIYGEHFEILSDPFQMDGGIAVHARSIETAEEKAVRLPTSILLGYKAAAA